MSPRRRILVVSDDEDLRQVLVEQLQVYEEFIAEEAPTGTATIDRIKEQYFDAIVLDTSLPDICRREVCRVIRRAGVKSPFIMLTNTDTDHDPTPELYAGANQYVTKPS